MHRLHGDSRRPPQGQSHLSKADDGIRGIVIGDVIRRLVACTVDASWHECVPHILQTLTESDEHATIISIDGIGAFDLASQNAMLRGLLRLEDGEHPRTEFLRSATHVLCGNEGGEVTTPTRVKVANRVTPSCPSLSVWGSNEPLLQKLTEDERLFQMIPLAGRAVRVTLGFSAPLAERISTLTEDFAVEHDARIYHCLCLGVSQWRCPLHLNSLQRSFSSCAV